VLPVVTTSSTSTQGISAADDSNTLPGAAWNLPAAARLRSAAVNVAVSEDCRPSRSTGDTVAAMSAARNSCAATTASRWTC
jgi:hypothetical protein